MANLTNSFLRSDGGSIAIGAIDINPNITKNEADPLSNQDETSEIFVDKNAITTVDGDIKLNVGSDLVRSLGCYHLTIGKKFTLLLRTDIKSYRIPYLIHNY